MTVTSLKYLGWVLTDSDDYWTEVVGKIRKSWNIWARLVRIMGREGASLWVSVIFQDGGAGGSFIWVGDVRADPLHETGPGKFLAQGRQENYGEAAESMREWGMGVTTAGDINGGGRV